MKIERPNPDELLASITEEEKKKDRAKLRLFFGMSAGVGKTFAMLEAAQKAKQEGTDVVVGIVETHGRKETEALIHGLETIPRKKMEYKGTVFEELDLEAVLARKPRLVLIDELAHTNIPGARHTKRYQDVLEILDAGIDVYTTVNVQHIESRKENVEKITGVSIRETVPDSILERSDSIELIDITPIDLLKRLKAGKVYLGDIAGRALSNFFKEAPLTALREIALRLTAEHVDRDIQEMTTLGQTAGAWNLNERLMVAVSHSPYSEQLIRATRRIAYNLEAPWIAVYISPGEKLSDKDERQLKKNLDLARELSAQVITLTDLNVVSALQRIAKQKNVTQIVIGRPTARHVRDLFGGGDLLSQLVRHAGDLDVHVIRHPESLPTRKWRLSFLKFETGFRYYWYSFWIILGTTLLNLFVQKWVGYRAVGFIFLMAVLSVGFFESLGPILFTAILSGFIWNFFFIPPGGTLYVSAPEDMMMLFAYFIVTSIAGILTYRIMKQQKILREREERTQLLYEASRVGMIKDTIESYVIGVLEKLSFAIPGTFFVLPVKEGKLYPTHMMGRSVPLDMKEFSVVQWVFEHNKMAGKTTETLSGSHGLYIPLRAPQTIVGVLGFFPKAAGISTEQLDVIYTVSREIALVIEREHFGEKLRETQKIKESEKLYQGLLGSISQELKIPLVTISGSARALKEDATISQTPAHQKLVDDLLDAGERLNWIVENLLDMTRISTGVISVRKEKQDVVSLVKEVLKKYAHMTSHHQIVTRFEERISPVLTDGRLLDHAISNILLNAISYAPHHSVISVAVIRRHQLVEISVNDEGPGIQAEEQEKIFQKFYRIPGTIKVGTGLGLHISKTLVELLDGRVYVTKGEGGVGSKFVISLKMDIGK